MLPDLFCVSLIIAFALLSFPPLSCLVILESIVQPVLIVDFYHTGCQVELVVLFVAIETVIGIEVMMNLHRRLLRRKS